mgnify:CR=1 FL=1
MKHTLSGFLLLAATLLCANVHAVEITVAALPDRSAISEKLGEEALMTVTELKVNGTINAYDIMVLNNKTLALKTLDLSDARILATENGYQYRSGYTTKTDTLSPYSFWRGNVQLTTLILPNSLKVIEGNACYDHDALQNLTIGDQTTEIGGYAFYNCSALQNLTIGRSVQQVGYHAFYLSRIKKNVYFTGSIADWCNISFANSTAQPMSYSTYDYTNPNLYINDELVTDLVIPSTVTKINAYAFTGCGSLTSVKIPSSIRSIGTEAFNNCSNIDTVYTYTVEPTQIDQNTFSVWTTATLKIPYTSRYIYWYNTQWSQFIKSTEFNEPYDYFYGDGDIELGDEIGTIEGEPDVDLNPGAGLIISGETFQKLAVLNLLSNGTDAASVIACNNLSADTVVIQIELKADVWHFFCFPYDIKKSDLSFTGKSTFRYVFRTYDGDIRAAQGMNGWKNVTASEGGKYLYKGKGYIFQCNEDNVMTIKIANPTFSCVTEQTPISAYVSSRAQDAGWNLVGNPFPSYYDMDELYQQGYTSPVIIWNGNGYDTYRPGDDEYHFFPFEGFFTQFAASSTMPFGAEGRETKTEKDNKSGGTSKMIARSLNLNPERELINFTLSTPSYSDRARLVFNPKASNTYEAGVDAAKMHSADAPVQLFITDDGIQYAIDERQNNAGDIALGFVATTKGEFTLSAPRMDAPVILHDNVTNIDIDLSMADYTFTSEAGSFPTRFAISKRNKPADLESLTQSQRSLVGDIYSINGTCVSTNTRLGDAQLSTGTFVFVSGDKVIKFINY